MSHYGVAEEAEVSMRTSKKHALDPAFPPQPQRYDPRSELEKHTPHQAFTFPYQRTQ